MKSSGRFLAVLALIGCMPGFAQAAEPPAPKLTLISNVNIFDGKSEKLHKKMHVLVKGNRIETISSEPLAIIQTDNVTIIDGGGRTLMPGLIDAHVHISWVISSPYAMFDVPPDYQAALTLAEARATLMRGFTSVRDTTGQVLGAKRAIDEGLFPGPRIWASGAGISMTSGHGDFRFLSTLPRQMGGLAETEAERIGLIAFADGVPEVLTAARVQMRKGAHFLKMFTSGAVSGLRDPLDIGEFSFDEIKAVADEAKRWNTYLAVHTYNDKGTRLALEAGAMSIEHGNLMTEETMKLAADKGAFLSTQTGLFLGEPPADWNAEQRAKQIATRDGLDTMFAAAKKYKVKIALGTDLVGTPSVKAGQSKELSNRLPWFTPAEILSQATANNGELLAMSGPRNPYPGKLGVIEEGALADILLVNGNPVEDLTLFHDPENNLALIMKDGKIYKNTIE